MTTTMPEPYLINFPDRLAGWSTSSLSLTDTARCTSPWPRRSRDPHRFQHGALLLTNYRNDTRCCP
jgi:hypothetical protein